MVSIDILEHELLRNGHRITEPRRALLMSMQAMGDHFTAEGLAAASPGVGRATVFRTLKLLQEVGTVCQVVLDDGTLQYRLTPGGHHHHIVCSRCGAVNDFASCDIQGLLNEIADRTGYAIDAHRLEVYGRCAACRRTLEG
ncbi:MAG: Fur family transcriptional regulator [Dehalococcoidia bacterium]